MFPTTLAQFLFRSILVRPNLVRADAMPEDPKDLRHPARNDSDQRQQRIDPAQSRHADPDRRPKTNAQQPDNLPKPAKFEIEVHS